MPMPLRSLGSLKSAPLGLGCMSLTPGFYSNSDHTASDQESIAVIHRALDLGVTLLDTSDLYTAGLNEELVGRAIEGRRDQVVIATKWGPAITDGKFTHDASPEACRRACAASLKRLGVDSIDLWILRGVDGVTPIEDTITAMAELVKAGKVKTIGLSEVSPTDIRKAHAIHPITAIEMEWSLWSRDAERDIVPLCRELGIAFLAYSPLGRGFLTGQIKSREDLGEKDFRRNGQPRFSEANFDANMKLVEAVKSIADRKGVTPGQLALAWVLAQGPDVFPIPGTKRIKYLEENMGAWDVSLSTEEMAELEAAVPVDKVVGDRYADMAHLTYHYDKK